jgi:cytochrome b involved in lipid metabolism
MFFLYQVYDVGSYLDEHPGGDDVILATTGIYLHFHRMKLNCIVKNIKKYVMT